MSDDKYKQLVTEVFGSDYYELVYPERLSKKESECNAKICIIKTIMGIRIFMGYENTGKNFDFLYDLPLPELMNMEIQYEDLKYNYAKKNGIVK